MRRAGNPRFSALVRLGSWWEKWYKKAEMVYRDLLEVALRHRIKVLVLAAVIFIVSIGITRFMGKEFVPPEDQSRFIVRLEAPVDYSVDNADGMFSKAEDIVKQIPEVVSVLYIQGYGRTVQINKGILLVNLKKKSERKKSQEQIKKELRRKFLEIPGLKGTAEDVSLIGGGVRNVPIQYSIRGIDLSALQSYTRQIVYEFSKLPGVVDVDTSLEAGKPELKVFINRGSGCDQVQGRG